MFWVVDFTGWLFWWLKGISVSFSMAKSLPKCRIHFSPLVSGVIFQENGAHWWAWLCSPEAPSHQSERWSSLFHLMRKTRCWIRITPRKVLRRTRNIHWADAVCSHWAGHSTCMMSSCPHSEAPQGPQEMKLSGRNAEVSGKRGSGPRSFSDTTLPCMPYILRGLYLSPKTEPAMEVWITESPREFPSS